MIVLTFITRSTHPLTNKLVTNCACGMRGKPGDWEPGKREWLEHMTCAQHSRWARDQGRVRKLPTLGLTPVQRPSPRPPPMTPPHAPTTSMDEQGISLVATTIASARAAVECHTTHTEAAREAATSMAEHAAIAATTAASKARVDQELAKTLTAASVHASAVSAVHCTTLTSTQAGCTTHCINAMRIASQRAHVDAHARGLEASHAAGLAATKCAASAALSAIEIAAGAAAAAQRRYAGHLRALQEARESLVHQAGLQAQLEAQTGRARVSEAALRSLERAILTDRKAMEALHQSQLLTARASLVAANTKLTEADRG